MSFLKSIFGKKDSLQWKESRAHLLLLSRYKRPKKEDHYTGYEDWEDVLGEPVKTAIDRFKRDDALREAELDEKLMTYTVKQLKPLLKDRGLPVSGKKAVLISRLVEADPIGMERLTKNLQVLVLTDQGQQIVQDFQAMEEQERALAEQESLLSLRKHDFKRASLAMASYEAKQVFARGMGIDWKDYSPDHDIGVLTAMFTGWPALLDDVPIGAREDYRIASAMSYLFSSNRSLSKWLPDDIASGTEYEDFLITNMLFSYGVYKPELKSIRNPITLKK